MSNPDLQDYISFISDKYLAVRPRSEKEMRQYLTRKLHRYDLSEEDIVELVENKIDRLKDIDLINDVAFAQWYIGEKTQFKLRGSIRLRVELRLKGISDTIIEEALATKEQSDPDLLPQILDRRYSAINFADPYKRQKVTQALLRRGFAINHIKQSIEDFLSKE